ncbi:NAD(P)/FAD-dependent oxidoreductase [soil metagenome]
MEVETVVIGAGVVGLAVAHRLAARGHEVLLLEEADAIGSHTSSRNSEVIHAGIYYAPGSLKARLCVSGRQVLYDYCNERSVPAAAIGKLIVATSDAQIPTLKALQQRGTANGVTDLTWLDGREVRLMEPEIECRAALYSPSTGIVDSHALMLALQGDAEAQGAQCVFHTRVGRVVCQDAGFEIQTSGKDDMALGCTMLINCAGLEAQTVARNIEGYPSSRIPPRYLAKGNYFSVSGATPFSHLIYPVPAGGGLGVHVTLDLSGRMRLGPDLHWVSEIDYTPNALMADQFYAEVSTFWPGIVDRELSCTYSGIRPKISGPGSASADFVVDGPEDHGIPGLVNFFGIESPGLTSSLALADLAVEKLGWS